jgi:diguanylate cyclase (GGDEF)-like protein
VQAIHSPALDHDVGDQRWLMGYVSGWMYAGVGAVGLLGLALPALRYHAGWQLGLGAAAVIYGLLNVRDVLHWERRPIAVHIAAMWAALPVIAVALWATGGAHSYLRPVMLLAPVHWGFFLTRRRALAALCAGLMLAFWSPLLYQPVADGTIGTLATLSLTIAIMAAALSVVRSRLDQSERALRELAQVDPLTGLLNRRGFRRALDQLVDSVPGGGAAYLVLLDLDDLKRVNDCYGHPAGDEALQRFAERLAAAARHGDVVARLGGDEFAVAGRTRDPDTIDRVASRLELAVSGELAGSDGVQICATTGWAVATMPALAAAATAEALFRDADEQLLANKRLRSTARIALVSTNAGRRSA